MATYWRDEEKIQLLLNIIESSNITPDFASIKLPKGRDQKACELQFQILKDAPPASFVSSFTPANAGTLGKRSRDDGDEATTSGTGEAPPKKKRGRPPKPGGPTQRRAEQEAWAAATGQPIPKKKRGRPPKLQQQFPPPTMAKAAVLPATMMSDNQIASSAAAAAASKMAALDPNAKRGKGRPPKPDSSPAPTKETSSLSKDAAKAAFAKAAGMAAIQSKPSQPPIQALQPQRQPSQPPQPPTQPQRQPSQPAQPSIAPKPAPAPVIQPMTNSTREASPKMTSGPMNHQEPIKSDDTPYDTRAATSSSPDDETSSSES